MLKAGKSLGESLQYKVSFRGTVSDLVLGACKFAGLETHGTNELGDYGFVIGCYKDSWGITQRLRFMV